MVILILQYLRSKSLFLVLKSSPPNSNLRKLSDQTIYHLVSLNATEIAPALTCIRQKSCDTGVLPEDWRCANINPVSRREIKQRLLTTVLSLWHRFAVSYSTMLSTPTSWIIWKNIRFSVKSNMVFEVSTAASPNWFWLSMTLQRPSTTWNRLMSSSWTFQIPSTRSHTIVFFVRFITTVFKATPSSGFPPSFKNVSNVLWLVEITHSGSTWNLASRWTPCWNHYYSYFS